MTSGSVELDADTDAFDLLCQSLISAVSGSNFTVGGLPVMVTSGSGESSYEQKGSASICLMLDRYEVTRPLENSSGDYLQSERMHCTALMWAKNTTGLMSLRSLLRSTSNTTFGGWCTFDDEVNVRPIQQRSHGVNSTWGMTVTQQVPQFVRLYSSSLANSFSGSIDPESPYRGFLTGSV